MAHGRLYWGLFVEDANRNTWEIGNLVDPIALPAITGTVFQKQYTVAASTTKTAFDISTDLADFDLIAFYSDKSNVYVEWGVDVNNGIGDEYATFALYTKSWWHLLADDAYANYTSNFGGGTLDKIEKFRMRNVGTETATVTVFAVT